MCFNTQRANYREAVPLGVSLLPKPHYHNHVTRHINMASLIYSLLPTEILAVDPAPKYKRVELSPLEIQQAVEAAAVLAK